MRLLLLPVFFQKISNYLITNKQTNQNKKQKQQQPKKQKRFSLFLYHRVFDRDHRSLSARLLRRPVEPARLRRRFGLRSRQPSSGLKGLSGAVDRRLAYRYVLESFSDR